MRFVVAAVIAAVLWLPVLAQDFEKGYDATRRGNFAAALREWRPLAELGDARAQRHLAYLYDNGLGVARDFAEAARWFRAAAEQGDAEAQYNLGALYRQGWGVGPDSVRAHMWFSLAAARGNDAARTARDIAEDEMTPDQIAEARRLAREWRKKREE